MDIRFCDYPDIRQKPNNENERADTAYPAGYWF